MTSQQLIDLVPAEHKTIVNGEVYLSEMGIIHLTTLVEQRDPEKAMKARALRYSASQFCSEYRKNK